MVWNGGVNRVSEGGTRAVWSSLNNRTEQNKVSQKRRERQKCGMGYSNVDGRAGCAELGVGQLL